MTIPVATIGTVFTANEISQGVVIGASPVTFTETVPFSLLSGLGGVLGNAATVTITAVSSPNASGVQTISGVIGNSFLGLSNGQVITGTTLGNNTTDFIITGGVLGITGAFLFTNTPGQQPGIAGTITVPAPSASIPYTPACYCTGTLIRTESGDTPVEALSIGDRVVTTSGAVEPIIWLGTRSYAGRFLAANSHLLPIRFRAGSLADGVPSRDLLVSPKHAMLIDDVLIAAELLVNGTTIVREHGAARVDYVHIELAEHGVIYAEGAASETFVDDDSRGIFTNAHTFEELYPATARTSVEYCAPRVTDGFKLDEVRLRLRDRAGRLAA